jgi:hypothetical protein
VRLGTALVWRLPAHDEVQVNILCIVIEVASSTTLLMASWNDASFQQSPSCMILQTSGYLLEEMSRKMKCRYLQDILLTRVMCRFGWKLSRFYLPFSISLSRVSFSGTLV